MFDKNHSRFPEYEKKFREIWGYYAEEKRKFIEKHPPQGFDDRSVRFDKECAQKIKELQTEYSFLRINEAKGN